MSYSQHLEEAFILEYFKDRKGRFLDIGAADGVKFSNTRALFERGWSGVCVEPNPHSFVGLLKTYGDEPKVRLWNVALSVSGGIREFHGSPDTVVATFTKRVRDEWATGFKFQSWVTHSMDARDFLRGMPSFDFASIDTDGTSYDLAEQVVFFNRPELVCVECDPERDKFVVIMQSRGYSFVKQVGDNEFWRRNA